MTDPLFLVVDIETLGWEPPAALIELGWCSVRRWSDGPPTLTQRWDDREQYAFGEMEGEMLFGTGGQVMTADNRAVHHINPIDLEDLPVFRMEEWTGAPLNDAAYTVAHNNEFEKRWLDFGLRWVCTYKCALHAFPDAPSHSNQALKYHLGMTDDPMLHPPHRALPDARVTAFILTKLLDAHPLEQLLQWTAEPRLITKLPFGKHKGTLIAEAPADYLDWVAGPKCDNADPDLKYACKAELERRRAANSPFAALKENGSD